MTRNQIMREALKAVEAVMDTLAPIQRQLTQALANETAQPDESEPERQPNGWYFEFNNNAVQFTTDAEEAAEIKRGLEPGETCTEYFKQAAAEFFQAHEKMPSWIKYDPVTDVFTIHGKKYAASLFGNSGFLGNAGDLLRIEKGGDDVVTVTKIPADQQAEPLAKDADERGPRLNEATWAAIEAWNSEVMGPITGTIFNNIKGVVRAAILNYCEGYTRPAPAVVKQLVEALRYLHHNARKSGAEMGLALILAEATLKAAREAGL